MIFTTRTRYVVALAIASSAMSLVVAQLLAWFVVRGELQHHLGLFWITSQPMYLAGAGCAAFAYRWHVAARTPLRAAGLFALIVVLIATVVAWIDAWLAGLIPFAR